MSPRRRLAGWNGEEGQKPINSSSSATIEREHQESKVVDVGCLALLDESLLPLGREVVISLDTSFSTKTFSKKAIKFMLTRLGSCLSYE